jgi:hypothetical protein
MNEAIKFYMQKEVNVFFGPVCDFSVAPVARQVFFWDIPLVSVGAFAKDFSQFRMEEYNLLTRVGPFTFDTVSRAYLKLIKHYNWNRFKIIYDREGQSDYMEGFCHIASSSLHYEAKEVEPNMTQDYFKIMGDFGSILRNEVGLTYSGE